MAALKLARMRLAFDLLLARHGWSAALALLAAVIASVLAAFVLPPLAESIDLEQRRLTWLAQRPPIPAPLLQSESETAPLHAFESLLAEPKDRIRFVRDVWDSASTSGVGLEHVEYRSEAAGAGGFARLRLRLPLRGRYPAIKRYAFALMAHHPALALERLDLSRERANQDKIEAQLQFSLLVRDDDER